MNINMITDVSYGQSSYFQYFTVSIKLVQPKPAMMKNY